MSTTEAEALWRGSASPAHAGRWLVLSLLVATAASALILIQYHDRSWWPPDDGAYAHVAERILRGEVLNGTVQDIHAGYVNFVNAAMLALLGESMVSMRYPLAVLGVVQACLMFALFAPRGAVAAICASVALSALSFVQFPNPTANWYAQFLLIAAMACMAWWPRGGGGRVFVLGLVIGTLFLFRQLSGVIVAIGVIAYLTCEAARDTHGARVGHGLVGRALVLMMAAGLAGYLLAKSDGFTMIVLGVWPLAILAWVAWTVRAPDRAMIGMLVRLGAGAVTALAPLMIYHLANGSLASWFDDTVLTALGLTELDFLSRASFGNLALLALSRIAAFDSPREVVNGVFWTILVVLPMVLGALLFMRLLRDDARAAAFHPVPFLAVFYALVSVHYQIPIYLMYATATTLAGLLWLTGPAPSRRGLAAVVLATFLATVGLAFHAGQPASRDLVGIIGGVRVQQVPCDGLARCGIRITPRDLALYRHFVALIDRHTRLDEAILALPSNSEIYYLGRRRNPFRFFNSALGLTEPADIERALAELRRDPPKLVFHRPADKYNTSSSARIMAFVARRYDPIDERGGFRVYRLRQGGD